MAFRRNWTVGFARPVSSVQPRPVAALFTAQSISGANQGAPSATRSPKQTCVTSRIYDSHQTLISRRSVPRPSQRRSLAGFASPVPLLLICEFSARPLFHDETRFFGTRCANNALILRWSPPTPIEGARILVGNGLLAAQAAPKR